MSFDELAKFAAELGFNGISATVRKGGHISPDKVAEDLPRMVEALTKHKLEIIELTTDIVNVDQTNAEKVLRTAAKLGIKSYRLGSLKYAAVNRVEEELEAYREQFSKLAALNRSIGIGGCYQIHSGANQLGAAVWDIWSLVKDYPTSVMGIAWDIRHATVEGGLCWPVNFRLARPHTGIVYAKDFVWQGRKAENVPLGEGAVDAKFYSMLTETGFTGPICLHTEYPLPADRKGLAAAIGKDLSKLREWLAH